MRNDVDAISIGGKMLDRANIIGIGQLTLLSATGLNGKEES
jgi:hypothetical protein